jgi:hypothetical protein
MRCLDKLFLAKNSVGCAASCVTGAASDASNAASAPRERRKSLTTSGVHIVTQLVPADFAPSRTSRRAGMDCKTQ